MEHFDQVQRAYDELVASGDITVVPPGPNQAQTVDEQKAFMTRRAGYYLNQVDAGYGLLSKTTGNNVMGLSVDFILHKPEGGGYDIATDVQVPNGATVRPVNSGMSPSADLLPRWVQPTKELAGLNGDTPPPPTDDINAKLDLIISQNAETKQLLQAQASQLTAIQESQHEQTAILNQHTSMLQQILDKPAGTGGKFPIIYPQYVGRLLGFTIALSPQPPMNP